MAEVQTKTVQPVVLPPTASPVGAPITVLLVKGTSAQNNDTITVTGLTTVLGCVIYSTTGTLGTWTAATNVITITNGGVLVWVGLAWGT